MQALFHDNDRESDAAGREVMEAPLCAACVVELELDGVKEEATVLQRGLRRIEKADGGLTRRRWEAKDGKGAGRGHARRGLKVRESLCVVSRHLELTMMLPSRALATPFEAATEQTAARLLLLEIRRRSASPHWNRLSGSTSLIPSTARRSSPAR